MTSTCAIWWACPTVIFERQRNMGYRIINVTPEFRAQYEQRDGLDGPFFYDGNRVLYYSIQDGRYLNPQTDMFLTYEEYVAFTA